MRDKPVQPGRWRRGPLVAVLALLLLTACSGLGQGDDGGQHVSSCSGHPAGQFALPSYKGLNYGEPLTASGEWLGTRWLRPGQDGWDSARPALAADLDFIQAHGLGRVVRVFVGIDQAMVWDERTGFVRFDDRTLGNFQQSLDMFDAHGVRVIAVLFDQEEVSSPGNFRFPALDGHHGTMREGYLRAAGEFLRRFGSRPTIVGWDLFNEVYASLGTNGGLSRPPADDPVSPNYSDATVHAWMRDLYATARCAAPNAWFTFSDTTELYWNDTPNVGKYADSIDFYDIHVYDDHPKVPRWQGTLHKPYILGEVGADVDGEHYRDQRLNSQVVTFWLAHGRAAGVAGVLAHNGDGVVFPPGRGGLTATGQAVAAAPA